MRTETELELFPYLHSKFLGSEHVTFWQKTLPYKDGEEESRRCGESASFTSFKQQSLFNDTILLHRKSGKCRIDKYK